MTSTEKNELMERIKILTEELEKLKSMVNEPTMDEGQLSMDDVLDELEQAKKELKEKLEKNIEKFNKQSEAMKKNIEKVKAMLILETDLEKINVTDAIEGLTEELKELENEAETLKNDIEMFKAEVNSEGLSLTVEEINSKLKEFKTRLKDLKKTQIEKYNLRVEKTNKLLGEYKSKVPVNTDVYEYVSGLESLELCSTVVRDWQHMSCIKSIDYNKLIEMNNTFKSIDEKLGAMKSLTDELNEELNFINDKVIELDVLVTDEMSLDDVLESQTKVEVLSDLLLAFGTKLEKVSSDKKITEEEYKKISERYQSYTVSHLTFLQKVGKKPTNGEQLQYDRISKMVDAFVVDINEFSFKVESLHGKVLLSAKELFEGESKLLGSRFAQISEEIEKMHNDKLIDDNQYESLQKRMADAESKYNGANLKLNESQMYLMNQELIYSFLNGNIDGLEKTIDSLEKHLDTLEKPIKDRKIRKNIDAIFKRLEAEIKNIEKQLEMNKETDVEKYEATKERLTAVKSKLDGLGKKYRKKCPLLVRAVKSAKNFFKKYKKQLLLIAGLVAFAMMAHSVIIPAIIHGNILLAKTMPALRGPILTINNLLGGMIGTTLHTDSLAFLRDGITLGSGVASKCLLQGVALSGLGSAALIAPVVIMIKKLIEKMKTAELKQKLSEGKEKVVSGIKTGTEKVVTGIKTKKEEISENRKNKKSGNLAKKEIKNSIKETLNDFEKSGLTVEEYCKENNIEGFMADLLKVYDEDMKKNKEDLNNKKGGRK